jgi:hypothetical protein
MIRPDTYPTAILSQVVDPIGSGSPKLRDDEIMDPGRLRLTLGAQLPASVLELADQLPLLGNDRNDRIVVGGQEVLNSRLDVLQLGIAIRVALRRSPGMARLCSAKVVPTWIEN